MRWWSALQIELPYKKAHALRDMLHFMRKTGSMDIKDVIVDRVRIMPREYRVYLAYCPRRKRYAD